jgi:hypothetical protein
MYLGELLRYRWMIVRNAMIRPWLCSDFFLYCPKNTSLLPHLCLLLINNEWYVKLIIRYPPTRIEYTSRKITSELFVEIS